VQSTLTWIGIFLCVSQSAMFSGGNLAFYRPSRLRLELEARRSPKARRVLALRQDSNFLLATILWGNVSINVLLALLANSVLVGVLAFLFSTFIITWFGEIMPQAYFSRHPLRTASALAPSAGPALCPGDANRSAQEPAGRQADDKHDENQQRAR
jgi:CBS domain containing-hemolysin-like protein